MVNPVQVSIVTDSTCDVPRELVQQLGINVVPLTVIVDGNPLVDDDSQPRQTRHDQILSARTATTSQPSPGQFLEVYRELVTRGLSVISVHVSSLLSGTIQSAKLASSMLKTPEIDVIDSKTSSLAMGMAIIDAARAAANGLSRTEVVSRVHNMLASTYAYFTVGSLHHLHKIGRLGKVQSILGTLLDVKPILYVKEGQLALKERLRGEANVIPRLINLVAEHVNAQKPIQCAIVHIDAEEMAHKLKEALLSAYNCTDIILTRTGATMAAAIGPGSLGLFFAQANS